MARKAAAPAAPAVDAGVRVNIPTDPLNPKDNTVDVLVNGKKYTIVRGTWQVVPEAVAAVLEDSDYNAAIAR